VVIPFQNSAELQHPTVTCCFVGPTRSGKTQICATFPRPFFVFPANENSEETIRGVGFPFVRVSTMGAPPTIPETTSMDAILEQLLLWARQGKLRDFCDTICFESLSHYGEIVEGEIRRVHKYRDGRQVWGAYAAHFARLREVAFQLGTHIVFTALDRYQTDSDGNIVKHQIRVSGREGELLPASCDVVGYCEQLPSSPPRWQTHIQRCGHFQAGTRLRGMPPGLYSNFNFTEHIAPYL